MDYKKNSNIELFRLICMLLIIMHHAVFYSDVIHSTFGANKIIANIIYIGGKFGANV